MRILILANNDVGLYKFRKELIEELIKVNNVIICLPYGELVEPLKELGCKFIDTPVDRRGVNPITDLSLFKKYHTLLKTEKPDLVITYTIKPNIYGGFACRLMKIPYAINITGSGVAFQNQGILRNLVVTMYKAGIKRANVVFFENISNMQMFINEKIVNYEQTCLLNGAGVNLSEYSLQEYPEDDFTTRFLFVGRVMKEKGINELFEAMEKLHKDGISCSLDIVGHFEEDYTERIESYVSDGWLHYHGYQKDVRPFISNAHCFVLPSWHEGMANTNLECAAMGRPLITSNIHGCLESVIDSKSGFTCELKNAASLYQVMKKFIELPYSEKIQMGIEGRRHMENVFDKTKVVQMTLRKL